jgi:hypothetical protein
MKVTNSFIQQFDLDTNKLTAIGVCLPALIVTTHKNTRNSRSFSVDDFNNTVMPILGTVQFLSFLVYCYNSGRFNDNNQRANGTQGIPFALVMGMISQGDNMFAAVPSTNRKFHYKFYGASVLYMSYLLGMKRS